MLHLLQMKLDSLSYEVNDFLLCLCGSDTAGKIRHVGSVAGRASLDNDGVTHKLVLQSGLLENTVECAAWNVNVRVSGNRDDAGLLCVLEMAVTAASASQIPAIGFHEFDCFSNFHAAAYHFCLKWSTRVVA